jgi:hypothetical protein
MPMALLKKLLDHKIDQNDDIKMGDFYIFGY